MTEQSLSAAEQRWADRLERAWELATGGALLAALDAAYALLAELPGDTALAAGTHLLIGRVHLDLSHDPDRDGEDLDHAITHLRQGRMAALPSDLAALGAALAGRYMDAEPDSPEEEAALDGAIAELESALVFLAVEPQDPELIEAGVILGILLCDRDEQDGPTRDVERALDVLRSALPAYEELDEHDPDIRMMGCAAWGRALADRIGANDESGERGDLDLAIKLLTEVVAAQPQDDPVSRSNLTDRMLLADLLRRRSARDDERRDAERGIALLRPIAESMPADQPERGEILHDLALLYTVRCGSDPSDGDLDAAIAVAESALPAIPSPWGTQIAVLLAVQFTDRARRRHQPNPAAGAGELAALAQDTDIRAARALLTEHLPQLSEDHYLYPTALTAMLLVAGATIGEESSTQDVDRLVDLARKARAAQPAGSEEHLAATSLLGVMLADQAWRTSVPQTIDEAVAALEEAVARTPESWEIRNLLRMNLGSTRASQAVEALDTPATQAALDLVVEAYSRLTTGQRDSWMATDVLGRACFSATSQDLPGVDTGPAIEMLERHLDDDPPVDPQRRGVWLTYTGMALISLAYRRSSTPDLDRAIGRLVEAVDLLPPGHSHRYVAMTQLASALVARYGLSGDASDLEAAQGRLDRVRHETPAQNRELLLRILDTLQEHIDTLRERFAGEAADDPAAQPRTVPRHEFTGQEHPGMSSSFVPRLRASRAARFLVDNAGTGDAEATRAAVAELVSAAEALPDSAPERAMFLGIASETLLDPRLVFADHGLLSDSIQALRKLLLGRVSDTARCNALIHLSLLLHARYGMDSRELDRREAVDRAREALEAVRTGSVVMNAAARMWLALVLREEPGSRAEAVLAGVGAVTGFATEVFLQGDARDALARTRSVADQAVMVAGWCLEDGAPDQAITTLELGRGLLLHAATTATDLGDLLESVGRTDLAVEWRRDAGEAAVRSQGAIATAAHEPAYVPSALRKRVLDALAGLPQGNARLLSTPTVDEIAAGLRAGGRDALVYLVGATQDTPGHALAVLADGRVRSVDLPALDAGPGSVLARFAERRFEYRRRSQSTGDGPGTATPDDAAERWRQALDAVSAWAWPAVVAPVLELVQARHRAASGPPSIVLVPFGELGAVPWHAACAGPTAAQHAAGRPRYALDDAVISYAASARQFLETAGRPRPDPNRAPLFVSNTLHDLWWASLETAAIRTAHYPDAPYFGQIKGLPEIEVEPQDLLARLSGGADAEPVTMLHVACHGESGSSPLDSCLYLTDMARLETRAVLRRAFDRAAPAPGGLVVLGSCLSDASERDHDEALTVATAFVTAGATSVVGTQWEAPDRRSALLMFMFHHHLAAGSRPVDALREAQLWMLDPGREVPAAMPEYLAAAARRAPQSPSDRLDTLDGWAAYVHHGW